MLTNGQSNGHCQSRVLLWTPNAYWDMLMHIFTPCLFFQCVFTNFQCVITLLHALSVALSSMNLPSSPEPFGTRWYRSHSAAVCSYPRSPGAAHGATSQPGTSKTAQLLEHVPFTHIRVFFQSVGNGAGSLAIGKIAQFWYSLGKVKTKMNLIN